MCTLLVYTDSLLLCFFFLPIMDWDCVAHRPSTLHASSTSSSAPLHRHACDPAWRAVRLSSSTRSPRRSFPTLLPLLRSVRHRLPLSRACTLSLNQPICASPRHVRIRDGSRKYACTSTDTGVATASPSWPAAPPSVILLAAACKSPSTTSSITSISSSSTTSVTASMTTSLCASCTWSSSS
jgi:hypothetical protein